MVRDLKLSRSFEYVTKIICTNDHADQSANFKVSAKFLNITLVNFILIIFLKCLLPYRSLISFLGLIIFLQKLHCILSACTLSICLLRVSLRPKDNSHWLHFFCSIVMEDKNWVILLIKHFNIDSWYSGPLLLWWFLKAIYRSSIVYLKKFSLFQGVAILVKTGI